MPCSILTIPPLSHHRAVRSRFSLFATALLALLGLAGLLASSASALTEADELTRFGNYGSGAGELGLPGPIATNPVTGHVYIVDLDNRINEFTPWGGFVKAFGWDVAPGAVNEQQEVRVRAGGGQFRLSYGSGGSGVSETADLPFNASAGEVQTALNALANISGGAGSVGVTETAGTADGVTPYVYVVTFKGALAATDVAQLTASNGSTPLQGGSPSTSLEVRTRADGTAGGSGLESCTTESQCQAGQAGSGAGELNEEVFLAVGPGGDIYVREARRVQKFDSSGRFLLMFGAGVDEGPHHPGNLCTVEYVAEGDSCGGGAKGSGPGEFSAGGGIDVGSDGTVYVADKERIQEFEPDGSFKGEVKTPGHDVRALSLDPSGSRFYVIYEDSENVHELASDTGAEVGQLTTEEPQNQLIKEVRSLSVAVDGAGNVFVVVETRDTGNGTAEFVRQFDSSGNPLDPPRFAFAEPVPGSTSGSLFSIYNVGANSLGDVYVPNRSPGFSESFIRLFGPGPVSFEGPPPLPPTISAQFATTVDRTGATVAARINPHFWTDTHFYVQYGTGKCSEGGCEAQKPLPPGSLLSAKAVDAPVRSAGIFLEGLSPGTTYHYRFIAQGGGGETTGEEATFTTFPEPLGKGSCANEVFRFGFSAPLPDCRAYEMVSPVDKAGGDVGALLDTLNYSTALDQSSVTGDRFTYTSSRAFAKPEAAPYVSQFLATRGAQGWENHAIAPPQGIAAAELYGLGANPENEYEAFSPDLCQGWLLVAAEPPLAPGGREDNIDLYRRKNCEGGYEAAAPDVFAPELQGTATDGSAALIRANKLTREATPGLSKTYYATEGALHPVCILPSGLQSTHYCSAGYDYEIGANGPGNSEYGHVGILTNAISTDGSRVYWTESGASLEEVQAKKGTGTIYLRENPGEEQSEVSGGECTEAEKACTVAVSGTATTKASRFLGASKDGSRAIFEVAEGPAAGKLYEFELGSGSRELAGKGLGVAAMSDDLSRVYFVSEEKLSGTSDATTGRPNLYLDEEGTQTFIATLSRTDVSASGYVPGGAHILSNVNFLPYYHAARASATGESLAFISDRSLTGYDNTDVGSPLPCGAKEGTVKGVCDSEVYVYRVGSEAPVCVSCDPSGARPQGRAVERRQSDGEKLAQAASLPMANNQLYLPKGISSDGTRLFFNSYDALLPRDTNGKEDVYEWEAASSQQQCEEDDADLFVESSGGCLSLISSGESPQDSEVLDASSDGRDAFFTANASLLPQDSGLVDVYDAREGGGFPQPQKIAACEGEACQGPLAPPNDPTPGSSSFEGAGNVVEKPARKGRKHKRKHAHKKAKQHKRAAKRNRGGRR